MSMATTKELRVPIAGQTTKVSAILNIPSKAHSVLVLAHGAGAGMNHAAIKALAGSLENEGIATFRFQFPYMELGSKRPDRPELATATIAAAVDTVVQKKLKLPIFAGGRSFGGRMTTTAASYGMIPSVLGIICFGFPLHPSNKPGMERAAHLSKVLVPMLFIQGTRDSLSDLTLIRKVAAKNANRLTVHEVRGADHSYAVLKSSGRTEKDVLNEVATVAADFCRKF
jgi:uncharacterized protein